MANAPSTPRKERHAWGRRTGPLGAHASSGSPVAARIMRISASRRRTVRAPCLILRLRQDAVQPLAAHSERSRRAELVAVDACDRAPHELANFGAMPCAE